jgi:hypothetical protein
MKHKIGLVIAFLSGVSSTWIFIDIEKKLQNTASASPNDTPLNMDYSARLNELSNDIKMLKMENAHLIYKLNSITQENKKKSAEHIIKPAAPDLTEQELVTYKLNEISTNIIEKMGEGLQNYADKISTDFNNENEDIFWSEQQEAQLRAAINQDTELSGIAIRDIECKTSQCKISVFSGNLEQNQEIFEKLTRSIGKLYKNPSYYADPLESNGIKTIYFKTLEK